MEVVPGPLDTRKDGYRSIKNASTGTSPANYWEASPEKKEPAWSSLSSAPLEGACGAPRLNVALARLVDLKAELLAEARARGPDGPRMRPPQLARARAISSVDGWASTGAALARVVEAAGARPSERRRAWADSSKRASVPDAEKRTPNSEANT